MPSIDVSKAQPIARPIVAQAAEVYVRHLQPWLIGMLLHGSAFKGGIIPGCSDVDFQIYLDDSAFSQEGQLPLPLSLAIQRELAPINIAPFQYLQAYPLRPQTLPEWVGPIPGAYALLTGILPVPEATYTQLKESARRALERIVTLPGELSHHLLEHGGGRLERQVRLICTDVWPMLYHVLTVQHSDPIHVWQLPKDEAMSLLPPSQMRSAIFSFHESVFAYFVGERQLEQALTVLERAVGFLSVVKGWWGEQ